jgi:ABC-type transport system substrate-binding protein
MTRDGVIQGARTALARVAVGLVVLAAGCAPAPPPPTSFTWVVGQAAPTFDPAGPPDPLRWALERLLARGLMAEDSSGAIVPDAADSVWVSPDGLLYKFRLRGGLSFPDGSPVTSSDFRRALESGLNRPDHSTAAWLLRALTGAAEIKPGRPLPPLGLAAPDPSTLVIRLARPDSLLLRKLALPGIGTPFAPGGDPAAWRAGAGDYALAQATPSRWLLLSRRPRGAAPDTVHVRFAVGAGRVRAIMRGGSPDLTWPVPPGLLAQPLPQGQDVASRPARPERRLLLVMRPDLPPMSRPAARHAFAHGLNRGEIVAALGARGVENAAWFAGGSPFDYPSRDPEEVRAWLERGRLGRSVHAVMAYSADGAAAEVARPMQIEWARLGLDAELRPLRGKALEAEVLRRGGAQILLLESQALIDQPAFELAALVTPPRGPAVGAFRSGWVTRELDPWVAADGDAALLDPARVDERLAQELVALPLARLPWLWAEREGDDVGFHPHFGPGPRRPATLAETPKRRRR